MKTLSISDLYTIKAGFKSKRYGMMTYANGMDSTDPTEEIELAIEKVDRG